MLAGLTNQRAPMAIESNVTQQVVIYYWTKTHMQARAVGVCARARARERPSVIPHSREPAKTRAPLVCVVSTS